MTDLQIMAYIFTIGSMALLLLTGIMCGLILPYGADIADDIVSFNNRDIADCQRMLLFASTAFGLLGALFWIL